MLLFEWCMCMYSMCVLCVFVYGCTCVCAYVSCVRSYIHILGHDYVYVRFVHYFLCVYIFCVYIHFCVCIQFITLRHIRENTPHTHWRIRSNACGWMYIFPCFSVFLTCALYVCFIFMFSYTEHGKYIQIFISSSVDKYSMTFRNRLMDFYSHLLYVSFFP